MRSRALHVLAWIDFVPGRLRSAERVCRGRKDVERFRQRLRARGWEESIVADLTRAAQRRDYERLIRFEFIAGVGR